MAGIDRQPEIVVIGAGVAGLAAAQRLAASGRKVLIVEARDRVGGRVHSLRPAGWPVPVEAGAEFIHGEPGELWHAIRAANLRTYEIAGNEWSSTNGTLSPETFDVWTRIFERLPRDKDPDSSFAEFLERNFPDLPVGDRESVLGYVEGFNAADSRIISSRWLRVTDQVNGAGGGASAFRLLEGYDGLVSWLHAGLGAATELRLGTIARTIRWSRGEVEIDVASAAGVQLAPVRCRQTIVTVPLSVLRSPESETGALRFVPDLSEKWSAISPLKMGSVVKLLLRFRRAFWEEHETGVFGFLHVDQGPFPTWWTTSPVRTPVLTGWAGGPAALRLTGLSEQAVIRDAIKSLAQAFRMAHDELTSLLEAWHLPDWQRDPFSRGAYSYVGVGGEDAARRLAEPVAGTLFFAGEATHDTLSGTVGGALASGYRVADEVLQSRD